MHEALPTALAAALAAAPRRYRMPPLPAAPADALAAGTATALAWAIEAARRGDDASALFVAALADQVAQVLVPGTGDPAFQAAVLRAGDASVDEAARLDAIRVPDERTVRTVADAVAHPGKLRGMAPGAARDALAHVHAMAMEGAWADVQAAAHDAGLAGLAGNPALARLQRAAQLESTSVVRRWRALLALAGPLAGSSDAAAQGRAAARTGDAAERVAMAAFETIAARLGGLRVVRGLRVPAGFPGAALGGKDEWDLALLRDTPDGAAVVLLAEVKATPSAATRDLPKLLRGLTRLAQAAGDAPVAFASDQGSVLLAAATLRALAPAPSLPAHVVYCSTAAVSEPVPLSPESRAQLLAEPASIAFAQQLLAGGAPDLQALLPVWGALRNAPRLRAVLHQYPTALVVREAMLHPGDLLAALQA
jgi:hypothetical protein